MDFSARNACKRFDLVHATVKYFPIPFGCLCWSTKSFPILFVF